MIDTNNPVQVAWLKEVNMTIGDLTTTNASLLIANQILQSKVDNLIRENANLMQQNSDMGNTNTKLREENLSLKDRKKK